MPCSRGTQNQADFLTAASSAASEPRQRGPLGEQLTDAELEPIRVRMETGTSRVDYGSYVQGHLGSREEAIEAALTAAVWENRELTIEKAPKDQRDRAEHHGRASSRRRSPRVLR